MDSLTQADDDSLYDDNGEWRHSKEEEEEADHQSVTYQYREFLIFLVVSEPVSKQIGTGKILGTGIRKIWYRKKVSEPVSEKFDNETNSRRQDSNFLKIYNGYGHRIGTSTRNF